MNYKGERTSFNSAEPEGDPSKIWARDYERGSNFFLKYLETGDTKYLTGSEYITPVAMGQVRVLRGQDWVLEDYLPYIDYQSAAKQYESILPTSPVFFKMNFRANKVYPQEKLEFNQKYVFNKDAYSRTDANNHPLYYKTNELKLVDDGDYQVLSGARKKGLTIYEEKDKTGETVYLLSQRDVYKVYKNFLDWATAGTENMGERELALHLEKKVEEYLEYSHTKQAHVVAKDNSRLHIKYITALLADTGVCQDYADLYQLLCDITGLECKTEIDREYNGVGHGWNVVKVDGTWYHVDATWGDGNSQYDGLMDSCHIRGSECALNTGKWGTDFFGF